MLFPFIPTERRRPALTAKQEKFIQEYLIDLNATQAAIRAGYSPRTANEQGARLLANVSIRDALRREMAARSRRTGITQDRVLGELAKIAFLNPADVVDIREGGVRPDADPADLAAIQSLKIRRSSSEQGETEEREVRLADKLGALRLLGRHLGLDQPTEETAEGERPFQLPARLIAPAFQGLLLDVLDHGHGSYVLDGGRGSGKSSFLALCILQLIEEHPDLSALLLRKVAETLRDSVYAQIVWAIEVLGLSDRYECRVSPMEITRRATGQKIYFRGADKPEKIKSIKPQHGYIGIVWFEELDQFAGEEECRSICQSALRGGDAAWIFMSYNPPRTASAWVNKAYRSPRPGQLLHHSTYHQMPEKWLGRAFLEGAEHLKETNPKAYAHEYDGQINGTGGSVFENVRLRPISPEELDQMAWTYHGVDWGYYPDPWAYNRCHYDSARHTLYITGELTRRRAGNRETCQALLDSGVTGRDYLACDSAEPKSIADYREYGLDAHGVNKGAVRGKGSVDYSIKWLQSLTAIIIDPVRCPDTAAEFSEYEYNRDRNGDVISGYPDRNNHHIDAVRYATAEIWRRGGA